MFKAEANPRLTVLRMNKDFMDFMRFHYPDDAGQEFKMTVARAPPDPTTAAEPAFETPTRWDYPGTPPSNAWRTSTALGFRRPSRPSTAPPPWTSRLREFTNRS